MDGHRDADRYRNTPARGVKGGKWWIIGDAAALADGGLRGVRCGEHPIVVYRVAGALHATDRLCTHAFVPLDDGILEGFEVECPVHQARFDVRTGACVRFPASTPLRTFDVRERDGVIEVWVADDLTPARNGRRESLRKPRGPAA